jgi:hypothetical protein
MYTQYLADVRLENYDTLRSIPTKGLPDTFDEWRQQRDQKSAQIISGGNQFRLVEIDPYEFSDFCRKSNRAADMDALADFVELKRSRP